MADITNLPSSQNNSVAGYQTKSPETTAGDKGGLGAKENAVISFLEGLIAVAEKDMNGSTASGVAGQTNSTITHDDTTGQSDQVGISTGSVKSAQFTQAGGPGSPSLVATTVTASSINGTSNPKGNLWMQNLGQAVYLNALRLVANLQNKMTLQEALSQIALNNANEKMLSAEKDNIIQQAVIGVISAAVQLAVTAVSAGISVGLAVGSMRAGGSAEKEVDGETDRLAANPEHEETEAWIDKQADLNKRSSELDEKLSAKPPISKEDYKSQKASLKEEQAQLNKTAPGFRQLQAYIKQNSSVETGEENPTGDLPNAGSTDDDTDFTTDNEFFNQPETSFFDDEEGAIPTEGEIALTQQGKTVNDKEVTLEQQPTSGKATVEDKKALAQKIADSKEAYYEKMSDKNGKAYQKAVQEKSSQKAQLYNNLSQTLQSLTGGVNGMINAAFELVVANLKASDVDIQASLTQYKSLMDLHNQYKGSEQQAFDATIQALVSAMQVISSYSRLGA